MGFCMQCGAALKDDSAFCENCGAKVQNVSIIQTSHQSENVELTENIELKDGKTALIYSIIALLLYGSIVGGISFLVLAKNERKISDPDSWYTSVSRALSLFEIAGYVICAIILLGILISGIFKH